MKFIQMFPLWFWMIVLASVILPISYRIAKKGVKIEVETKLGSAEINVGDDAEVKKEEVKHD